MSDSILFQTICVGGPIAGETIIETVGKNRFVYERLCGGCELLPDDLVLVGHQSKVERDNYFLVQVNLMWPTGCYWCYQIWLHESLYAISPEWFALETFHLGDCYVERRRLCVAQIDLSSPFFRDGEFIFSEN